MEDSFVKIWEEQISIPTYPVGKPDKNPMFFEKRVYQGSSGVVYPYPVIEKIYNEKKDAVYHALFLENPFIKIMVLPELGGRIQMAYDKIKQRHFIYYNQVIKPALVGLTGPWISGGIEFNWPQHHRPGTFSPVDFTLEENKNGSKTIWVNELERMFHTKGMAGFTLYPDKAYIEIKVKLLNTSSLPQTFLWWANPAVKVNDFYQSVFPPDVNAVFDHGKRDVSGFPIATGTYYKVDYAPGTDISMYKNIPVPTSYMAINSAYDFVGGYEHDAKAGMLHVADHHVSPGKKQWTWGHSDFGQAWDRNLTDEDGPYIELMAGVFTDNQPDFTWILPNEEKSFKQYFLPYQKLGLVKNATKDVLLSIDIKEARLKLQLYATGSLRNIDINLYYQKELIFKNTVSIPATQVYSKEIVIPANFNEGNMLLVIQSADGRELIRYEPALNKRNELPEAAKPALRPEQIRSNEQLFLTGQHLEQYRHATYNPVSYYEKALERDAGDFRCNNALGLWWLRRGQFEKSIPYFRNAIATATTRNPNPYDAEPYYHLGIALDLMGDTEGAYDAFYKAAWDKRWKDSSYFRLAQIAMRRRQWELALEHIDISISNNSNNNKAYVVKAATLRNLNKYEQAAGVCMIALEKDQFNLAALFEGSIVFHQLGHTDRAAEYLNKLKDLSREDQYNLMAYALDYAAAGMYAEGLGLLDNITSNYALGPMVYYCMAWLSHRNDDLSNVSAWLTKAANSDPYCCFPNRLEEINILRFAIASNAADPKAPYYLGNLFYDKRQYQDAIDYWELSASKDYDFPTVLRNLGIAYFNKKQDREKALLCLKQAFSLDKTDARILMELDQLYKRLNRAPVQRMIFLEENMQTVLLRDDLYLEYISLLNNDQQFDKASELLLARQFNPWEGGEGKVSLQYVYSLVELAKRYLRENNFDEAIRLLERAQVYPHNLGEGKLYGAGENDIFYWLGCVYNAKNDITKATEYFTKATVGKLELSASMFYNDQQPDKIFYQGLAWKRLGKTERAKEIFKSLVSYGEEHMHDEVTIDYFAVSLPNLLVLDDDLTMRHQLHCYCMMGLGLLGLEQDEAAKEAFMVVLEADAINITAKTHMLMLEKIK